MVSLPLKKSKNLPAKRNKELGSLSATEVERRTLEPQTTGSPTEFSSSFMAPSVGDSSSLPSSDNSDFVPRSSGIRKHNSFEPSSRRQNSLEELTINKLNFHSLGLYGRDTEMGKLDKAFEESKQKKQLVMLAGYSGVGKTCLARTLAKRVRSQEGLYAEGKFEQQFMLNSNPYSAWATICGNICSHILAREDANAIGTKIQETLTNELHVLLRVFPALGEILVTPDEFGEEESAKSNVNTQKPADAKASLSFAFARLLRLVSQELSPIVLVLDDLQWADIPSLEMLETVMADREVKIMAIGIYRSNEVDDTHTLVSSMRDMKKQALESQLFDFPQITVGNLEIEAIVKFLNDLLSTTDSKIMGLASLCQKKTQGNVFFLIHFLKHLYSNGLLQYSFGSMSWNWNESEIEEKTAASDNVAELLLIKMEGLEEREEMVLQLAACNGASFRRKYLALLWRQWLIEKNSTEDANSDDQLDDALTNLVFDGYLFTSETSEDSYSFVHDKIQEAALSLTPLEGTSSFRQWVGQTLLNGLELDELGSLRFVVVNLLNEGKTPDNKFKRLELAELNARASKMGMELSAFDAASRYASSGISLLGGSAFSKEHYKLTIDLYVEGASAESCLGNTKKMEMYCKTVFERKDVAKEDVLRLKITWLDSLANRGMYREAIDETLSLLARFDVHFPKNRTMQTISTMLSIMKVRKGIEKGILKTIPDLPKLNDPTRLRLLHLMDRLSVYLYYIHDDLMPLVMLRTFQWTLDYGLNDVTPAALTTLGIIFAGVLCELQAGSACAVTALELVPKVSPWMEGRTLFVAHGFGVIWTEPMYTQMKSLQRAYEAGLSAGDAESASWAIMLFYHIRFLVSFSLDLVIADVEMYMAQMKDLNQIVAYRSTLVNYQMFLNLAGRTNSDPMSLTGEYCTTEDHARWMKEDEFYSGHCRLWECCIRTWYGEHEECAKLVLEYGSYTAIKTNPGTFSIAAFEVISKGISSFVAARTSSSARSRRKYRKAALSIRKRVKKWIGQGCPNFAHLDAFFDAEVHAMNGNHYDAVQKYQVAIMIAARGGLSMEAGLFSETVAQYFLCKGDDTGEATFRFKEAIKYYESFGAKRKIEMLQDVYSELLLPKSPKDLHTIFFL